jgi:hypothetical protein
LTGFHYVDHAGLDLLLQPSAYGDYRCEPLHYGLGPSYLKDSFHM